MLLKLVCGVQHWHGAHVEYHQTLLQAHGADEMCFVDVIVSS